MISSSSLNISMEKATSGLNQGGVFQVGSIEPKTGQQRSKGIKENSKRVAKVLVHGALSWEKRKVKIGGI